jgi:diguanylate cyclase
LEQKLRKSDYLFRFGGEEFIILLPTTSKDEAHMLGQELCNATAAEDAVFEGIPIRYTISIGVISILAGNTTPINNETIDGYVAQVDEKLYLAKERGRNRVE